MFQNLNMQLFKHLHIQLLKGLQMSRLSTFLILLCVSVPSFMINLDANIVAVSLPSIAHSIGASFADVEWVISAYTLTFASFVLPGGTLGDRFGRKRILLVGLFLFTAASFVCGAAPNAMTINLARAVQGLGAAFQLSAALAILSFEFRGPARAKAFAFWGTVIGIAMTLGPICGGFITQTIGWEWAFYINIPIGLLLMITTSIALKDSRDPLTTRLDLLGLVLFSGALFSVTFALITGNQHGWGSQSVVGTFVAATILAVAFVIAETRQERPMVELSYFRHPTYIGATIATLGSATVNAATLTYLPLYFQSALDRSPQSAGLMILPAALPMFIVPRIVSTYLSHRVSGRDLVSIGLLLSAVGHLSLGYGAARQSFELMMPGLVFVGMGAGFMNGEIARVSMTVFPPERAGMAAGMGGTVRFAGIVLAFATLGAILFAVIVQDLSKLSPDARSLAQQLMSGAHVDGLPSEATAIVAQGYSTIFFIVGGLIFAATLAAWFLISKKDTAPVKAAPATILMAAD
jgi:EmrB/QacA subfamily drug resistance transporter